MQTFLPLPDFRASLRSLDNRRLGKQRVEGLQLLNALEGKTKGWRNHPAAVMWRENVAALRLYTNIAIEEWIGRGFRNSMKPYELPAQVEMPWWLGDVRLHTSHRSNLLRKDREFYGRLGWVEPEDIPYWWPTSTLS